MIPHNRIRRFWFDSAMLDPATQDPGWRERNNLRNGDGTNDSEGPIPSSPVPVFPVLTRPGMIFPPDPWSSPSPQQLRFRALLHELNGGRTAVPPPRPGLWSRLWRLFWGE